MIEQHHLWWLAGLIEGEGCFSLTGPKRTQPVLAVSMTDEDTIHAVAQLLGAKSVRLRPQPNGYKMQYACSVTGTTAAGWMMTLYSLMGKRRRQRIREVLSAWRSVPPAYQFRTTCPQGHPYDEQNTYRFNTGRGGQGRDCRACRRKRGTVEYREAA